MEDYKKKYEEALERAKFLKENTDGVGAIDVSRCFEEIFPELKESDDERIRKEILGYFQQFDTKELHGVDISDWIAWLENKGKQLNSYSGVSFKYNGHIWAMYANYNGVDISLDNQFLKHFEMLVEQNPTENFEPKFKAGDWVVWDDRISGHIDNLYQGKESLMYTITDVHNMTRRYSVKGFDNNAHLWTIQDAKDGDVLVDSLPFIFKRIDNLQRSYAYCGISIDYGFRVESEGELGEWTWDEDIKPATKEQRDLLFTKMKEAGYEWDAEKKELKKIEQKSNDMVKAKFKVGDWIVEPRQDEPDYLWYINRFIDDYYWCDAASAGVKIAYADKECRLWTIQDAKEGDVLAAKIDEEPNDFIYVFKKYNQNLGFWSHCYLDAYTNKFHKGIFHNDCNVGVPATKEQRDLLFTKMKEAGYEWDAEKKELKKIEQKPTDKVEPKFKVGDFITDGKRIFQIEETVWERNNRNDGSTYCESLIVNLRDGVTYSDNTDLKEYHLWTIQDAKEGDVLVAKIGDEPNDFIYIFNEYEFSGSNKVGFCSHCYLDAHTNKFHKGIYHNNLNVGVPATKEQRDLLFSKMKEAGYEWDVEKKELKKIEQKSDDNPKWNELTWQDINTLEGIINNVHYEFRNGIGEESFGKEVLERFREIREDEYMDTCEQKPTWSEEDEKILNEFIESLIYCNGSGYNKQIDWLKSLKERIKGGEK